MPKGQTSGASTSQCHAKVFATQVLRQNLGPLVLGESEARRGRPPSASRRRSGGGGDRAQQRSRKH